MGDKLPKKSASKSKGKSVKEENTQSRSIDVYNIQPPSSQPSSISSNTTLSNYHTKRGTKSGRRIVDTESWVDKNLDELIEIFGLNMLELTKEEARVIVLRLVDVLRGESATIDKDTIRRRFTRYIQQIRQLIAQLILELREELTNSQVEFAVNNIGEAVLSYASKLYKEALRHKREDLVEVLRAAWKAHWTARRYVMLPVECPYCKFNSLMPDLGCIVCGASLTEEEVKKYIDFEKLLQDFVKQYSEEDVKKTIMYGYIYLNNLGLKPPTYERDKLDIELLLSNKEKEYLRSLLASIKGS